MNSIDFLKEVVTSHSDISTVRTFRFIFNNKIQDRITNFSAPEIAFIHSVQDRKKIQGGSFWENCFRETESSGEYHDAILNGALFHNPNTNFNYYSRDVFITSNEQYENTAFNSEVTLKNGLKRHIVMLDFKINKSMRAQTLCTNYIKALGLSGAIFDSGKSYHFISRTLSTKSELIEILAKFILLHPISDKSWAAHQIIEDSASLRISEKYDVLPTFVQYI